MARRSLQLIQHSFAARPAFDTAVSRAILQEVADGARPETLRLYRPGASVAFGPLDLLAPGYGRAASAARAGGFEAVNRLAGGRAAVFHEQTIAFAWTVPDPSPRATIRARFDEIAGIMVAAFRWLGVDARIGEVAGEYCPGAHSVNARGKTKLMGVGQRVVARAAHVGGVVVVGESGRVRDILVPVYEALALSWDPATAGSIADEVGGILFKEVEQAILAEFTARHSLSEGQLHEGTLALAQTFEGEHLAP